MMIAVTLLVGALAGGQAAPAAPSPAAQVQQADEAFWAAYNACDRDRMADAFTEDAEFYHDLTGLTRTREGIVTSLMNGPCGDGGQRLRREAVADTVRAYPLAGPYMFLTGDHVFYVRAPGQVEHVSARARFADVWRLEDGRWRMVRVVSYDHGPPPYTPPPADRAFDTARLPDYAGRYQSADFGDVVISVEGEGLRMRSGDLSLSLFPVSPTRFAAVERDLQFEFGGDVLTVLEGGTAVTTARRVP
jgi:hypothetical protein